jgi:hypothetical protein
MGLATLALISTVLSGAVPARADTPAASLPASHDASGRLACAMVGEIALIRAEMGRPADRRPMPEVSGAAVGDVHALATTLLVRANRLLFERTSELADDALVGGGREGDDVEALLDAAAARLAVVKTSLRIPEDLPTAPPPCPPRGWTDVATLLIDANRQLDQLLDERIASSDVFERVTGAVGHAARLVTVVGGEAGLPDPPAYERRRRPADVCRRLLTCLELVRGIDPSSIVRIELPEGALEGATPGDAYDLASVVAARVESLHGRVRGVEAAFPAYYPGPRLPSHAHQRAGILELQLTELAAHRTELARRLAPADRDAG